MTKTVLQTLLASTLLVALAAPPLLAQNQADSQEKWYQVEVILFAQSDNLGNEQNLKSVQLGYPRQQVFLDSGNGEIPPETLARLSPQDLSLYRAMVPQSMLKRSDPTAPVPFATLPANERLLTAEARNLERSGPFRVLFHQAWRQTLDGPRDSPWVIIQSGERVGDHHELEGSLRVYTDTQIVAQTDLWRSRFGRAATQAVPPVANGIASTPGSDPGDSNRESHDAVASDVTSNGQPGASGWPALPPAPRPPEPQLPPLFREAPSPAAFAVDARHTAPLQTARHAPAVTDIDRFEVSQIINTRELHYLDHPRLGALIRVIPYDPGQPEEELFDVVPLEDTDMDLEAPVPDIDDEVRD